MESLKLFFELNRSDRSMKHKKKAMSLFKKKKKMNKNKDKKDKERKHKHKHKKKKKRKSKKQINKYKPFEGETSNVKEPCPPQPAATRSPDATSPVSPSSPSPPRGESDRDSVSPSPMEDSFDVKPMTEEEFIAFMRRLTYYNLRYMNYKMIVGIDEQIITEDTRSVLTNIKKAIRFQIYNLSHITPTSIVQSSKYPIDQVKIIELNQILTSIDETKPMRA